MNDLSEIPPSAEQIRLRNELTVRNRHLLTMIPAMQLFQLNEAQRQRWETCPTCHAEPGYKCNDIEDAHPARLANAPYRVRLEAV